MMTDSELKRATFRVALFEQHGWPVERARAWAFKLVARDLERDDRRVCVECKHLTGRWGCKEGGVVVAELLQRCNKFAWQVPHKESA